MGDELPGRVDGRGIRAGVVGAGFMGQVHSAAIRRAGAEVAGVVASTDASTSAAATRFGASAGFASTDELIESPDIDVVHVCTPNHLHRPLAEAAIAAGKHVVCEKPLATSASDAATLTAAAERAGVVATVPFAYRFYPMVREARSRVRTGFDVRLVYGAYLQDWLSTADDYNWRVDAATSGPSRAFADIGSHWCDLLEFVTGDRIAEVCAEVITAVPERLAVAGAHSFGHGTGEGTPTRVDTEDAAMLLFRSELGVTGSAVISQISPGRKNQLRFEIAGADDTIAFDQEHPDELWIGSRASASTIARDPDVLDPTAARLVDVPPGHPQGYQECFDHFVADTYRAIAAGSTDAVDGLPSFADGARSTKVVEAVLRSAASRAWEPVADQREEISP